MKKLVHHFLKANPSDYMRWASICGVVGAATQAGVATALPELSRNAATVAFTSVAVSYAVGGILALCAHRRNRSQQEQSLG
jgi:hypothetical protein